jgi:hypothetical protein
MTVRIMADKVFSPWPNPRGSSSGPPGDRV